MQLAIHYRSKILERTQQTTIIPCKNSDINQIFALLEKSYFANKKLILKILNNSQFIENYDPLSYKNIIFHDKECNEVLVIQTGNESQFDLCINLDVMMRYNSLINFL